MTTDEDQTSDDLGKLQANLARVEELSQRLVGALSQKKSVRPSLQGPGHDVFVKAATAYMAESLANPAKIIEHQVGYWGKALTHYVEAQQALKEGRLQPPKNTGPTDRRFANPLWDSHPYFNYIKQQYLLSSDAISGMFQDLEGLSERDKQRVEFFTQQIIDIFSPTNFLGTNPEALSRAVETDGQSLVDGLENLVRDIEANDGEFMVSLCDESAFAVGENLATTPGSVVFRNRMLELIQYAPSTETVQKTPLIIFPPWINKFYILDLRPENSLIKWIVDQGYTLFVVSWVNPDISYADVGINDYVREGYLEVLDAVKAITGEKQVNAIGYCIAGTMLSLTLGLLEKSGDKTIKSATFFTTLTDFEDQGEMGVFLSDDFLEGIAAEAEEKGILHSLFMSRTFSYLRSNDLIYSPAIRNYLLGKSPPAFDLLYWNGDSTNLPATMTVEYLRALCQANELAREGYTVLGTTVRIADVKVPVCAIACETDHIAAWKTSFEGVRQMGSRSKTFILSESGHIAGIVNPPSKKKYGHYTSDAKLTSANDWLENAVRHDGSWWPRWEKWLRSRSGNKVPSRQPGSADFPTLAAAPGTYVVKKPSA
ncbi:MAG: class I poly(R)-hydroxyalkanoic acid synthase [Pseudomonadota bacterium]